MGKFLGDLHSAQSTGKCPQPEDELPAFLIRSNWSQLGIFTYLPHEYYLTLIYLMYPTFGCSVLSVPQFTESAGLF